MRMKQTVMLDVEYLSRFGTPETWSWNVLTGIEDQGGDIRVLGTSDSRTVADKDLVFLDTHESHEELGLEYVALGLPWNGFQVPWVTFTAFQNFVASWRRADLNSVWGRVYLKDGKLIHQRNDTDDPDDLDVFKQVGFTATGEPLYEITGWVFTKGEA